MAEGDSDASWATPPAAPITNRERVAESLFIEKMANPTKDRRRLTRLQTHPGIVKRFHGVAGRMRRLSGAHAASQPQNRHHSGHADGDQKRAGIRLPQPRLGRFPDHRMVHGSA